MNDNVHTNPDNLLLAESLHLYGKFAGFFGGRARAKNPQGLDLRPTAVELRLSTYPETKGGSEADTDR
jgi:hypothetical protein